LILRMRASPCIWLELALDARVALLIEDYDFFVADTEAFCARLEALRELRGAEVVKGWQADARAGRTADVVRELLTRHYDPIYLQSMRRNFGGVSEPLATATWDGTPGSLDSTARRLVHAVDAATAPTPG
jgi:tRNA 2-selenouridine synthase